MPAKPTRGNTDSIGHGIYVCVWDQHSFHLSPSVAAKWEGARFVDYITADCYDPEDERLKEEYR